MKTSSGRLAVLVMLITPLLAFYPTMASAVTVTVTVANNCLCFMPSSVTIHPGDTVQWTWSSSGHSSTSGSPGMPNGLWDSGILNQGAVFSQTFNTVGSFPYYCTPHGACCNMVGTVTVVSNPTPTPSPTATPVGTHPAFFNGETALGGGFYYLQFPNGTPFGYYSYLSNQNFIYHIDLAFEYLLDANDVNHGIYFYDFASSSFFYTSPTLFPDLYDFSLNAWLYYLPDASNPGRYTNNPRWFFNFATGQWINL
jgi:plastocyanin